MMTARLLFYDIYRLQENLTLSMLFFHNLQSPLYKASPKSGSALRLWLYLRGKVSLKADWMGK
jgi:hypothetical protein